MGDSSRVIFPSPLGTQEPPLEVDELLEEEELVLVEPPPPAWLLVVAPPLPVLLDESWQVPSALHTPEAQSAPTWQRTMLSSMLEQAARAARREKRVADLVMVSLSFVVAPACMSAGT
jgi:hypothetical protein